MYVIYDRIFMTEEDQGKSAERLLGSNVSGGEGVGVSDSL